VGAGGARTTSGSPLSQLPHNPAIVRHGVCTEGEACLDDEGIGEAQVSRRPIIDRGNRRDFHFLGDCKMRESDEELEGPTTGGESESVRQEVDGFNEDLGGHDDGVGVAHIPPSPLVKSVRFGEEGIQGARVSDPGHARLTKERRRARAKSSSCRSASSAFPPRKLGKVERSTRPGVFANRTTASEP